MVIEGEDTIIKVTPTVKDGSSTYLTGISDIFQ